MPSRPICVPCQRFFRVKRNGYAFVEQMPKENGALPGTQAPEQWQPYKLWVGDLMQCEGCGATIVSGFGRGPIAEHYQPDFDTLVEKFHATLTVNDC